MFHFYETEFYFFKRIVLVIEIVKIYFKAIGSERA